jgi:hypothetical protein
VEQGATFYFTLGVTGVKEQFAHIPREVPVGG